MDKLHAFYVSKPWMDLSLLLKIQCGGKCCKCGEIIADYSKLIGHHAPIALTDDNVDDAMVSLNPENIEIVCTTCHNKAHHRDWNHERRVYIVWGPPLSGKSAYVKQVSMPGDLILDINELWKAVTLCDDKPNRCKYNVFALRDLLYDQIKTRYGKWYDAYYIATLANPYERERVAAELGAELIYCEATREKCLDRAKAYCPEKAEYINSWFDEYEKYLS